MPIQYLFPLTCIDPEFRQWFKVKFCQWACLIVVLILEVITNTVSVKSWFSKPLDNSNQNLFSCPWSHCIFFIYFPLGFLNKKMAKKAKNQNEA